MMCRWVENPNSDALKRHIPRIHDYLWIAEDGMKTKVLYYLLSPPNYICQFHELTFIIFNNALDIFLPNTRMLVRHF
jgi:hypothetical protein